MPIPPKRTEVKIKSAPLWRARVFLKKQGLFAAIDAGIEAEKNAKPGIWEAWNHGAVIERNSRLMKRLNLTAAQVDAMFVAASKAD
jgi:Spy/CpxP family protein refolding chaperone